MTKHCSVKHCSSNNERRHQEKEGYESQGAKILIMLKKLEFDWKGMGSQWNDVKKLRGPITKRKLWVSTAALFLARNKMWNGETKREGFISEGKYDYGIDMCFNSGWKRIDFGDLFKKWADLMTAQMWEGEGTWSEIWKIWELNVIWNLNGRDSNAVCNRNGQEDSRQRSDQFSHKLIMGTDFFSCYFYITIHQHIKTTNNIIICVDALAEKTVPPGPPQIFI